jgi:putative redox protein
VRINHRLRTRLPVLSTVGHSVRPGFSAVRVEVTVTGPERPERYQELAAAVDQHCPVLDLFANPVLVTRTLAG